MLREISAGSPTEAEDLTPYGALSDPVQRRLETASMKAYGALASTDSDRDGVVEVPSSLNLTPYGALSALVQGRLSEGYAGYSSSTDDTVLVEAPSAPITNPRFSPGIQSQPDLAPYGALAGPRPLNF